MKAKGLAVEDFGRYFAAHPEFVAQAQATIRILDMNEATVRLFGAQDKEELLASLDKIFPPAERQSFSACLIALAQGKTRHENAVVS